MCSTPVALAKCICAVDGNHTKRSSECSYLKCIICLYSQVLRVVRHHYLQSDGERGISCRTYMPPGIVLSDTEWKSALVNHSRPFSDVRCERAVQMLVTLLADEVDRKNEADDFRMFAAALRCALRPDYTSHLKRLLIYIFFTLVRLSHYPVATGMASLISAGWWQSLTCLPSSFAHTAHSCR